jgi:hypothetical protein
MHVERSASGLFPPNDFSYVSIIKKNRLAISLREPPGKALNRPPGAFQQKQKGWPFFRPALIDCGGLRFQPIFSPDPPHEERRAWRVKPLSASWSYLLSAAFLCAAA